MCSTNQKQSKFLKKYTFLYIIRINHHQTTSETYHIIIRNVTLRSLNHKHIQ